MLTKIERVCISWLKLSKYGEGFTCWNVVDLEYRQRLLSFDKFEILTGSRLGNGRHLTNLKIGGLLQAITVPDSFQTLRELAFNTDVSSRLKDVFFLTNFVSFTCIRKPILQFKANMLKKKDLGDTICIFQIFIHYLILTLL